MLGNTYPALLSILCPFLKLGRGPRPTTLSDLRARRPSDCYHNSPYPTQQQHQAGKNCSQRLYIRGEKARRDKCSRVQCKKRCDICLCVFHFSLLTGLTIANPSHRVSEDPSWNHFILQNNWDEKGGTVRGEQGRKKSLYSAKQPYSGLTKPTHQS